jgi:hypothetical protein
MSFPQHSRLLVLFVPQFACFCVRYVCLDGVLSVIHHAHVLAPAFAFATSISPTQSFPQQRAPSLHLPKTPCHTLTAPIQLLSHCTMAAPPLKRNKYFQTAVLDPTSQMSATEHTIYLTSTPLPLPVNTIKLTIGSSFTQRVWYLPKSLLTRHSTSLASLCTSPSITLSEIDPRAFANFVDYMRSSIYTLNPQFASYHPIRSHMDAALLGEKLGAHAYADAAIRKLYMAFEPAAKIGTRSMRKCIVTPEIVGFVFSQNEGVGMGLKNLVCDAVAASWKRKEVHVLTIGQVEVWKDVYDTCEMFRETMKKSLRTLDQNRGGLLKPVGKYLKKTVEAKGEDVLVKEEVVSDSEGEKRTNRRSIAEQRRKILIPKMRLGGLKRRDSDERRRRQRTETEARDAEMEEWSAGIAPGEGNGEGEASATEDWILVDQERVEDVAEHEFA